MKPDYFGTDGIRGRAGDDLTPVLALRAASAFGRLLSANNAAGGGTFVLGMDPRLSSPMLAAAVASGLAAGGGTVRTLGIVPTPVVPFAVLKLRAAGGVMVTASHNPVPDNGLKFFDSSGMKIGANLEQEIAAAINLGQDSSPAPAGGFGRVLSENFEQRYLSALRSLAASGKRRKLRVLLDTAYGAASQLAPAAFEAAGCAVEVLHGKFDGNRINVNCGATGLAALARAVQRRGADLGLGFDGDADRVLAVDETGATVNGDKIIALFAVSLARYSRQRKVVMTHMSNLGVEAALGTHGITMLRTEVGDAKVMEELLKSELNLGGEQSGHIIMRDRLPGGDGIATGLQLCSILAAQAASLSALVSEFKEYPQLLRNLPLRKLGSWQTDRRLQAELKKIMQRYSDVRFYIRASGTEKLLRVLTEAKLEDNCVEANAAICRALMEFDAS